MKKVFISYSHKDKAWKDRVTKHLKAIEKVAEVSAWNDRKIEAGAEWFKNIETALKETHIAVLLISADFLGSGFINEHEIPVLKKQHETEGVRIIPLILQPCAWHVDSRLSSFQAKPKDGKPLSGMNDFEIETVLAELAGEICTMVKSWGVVPGPVERTFIPPPPDRISLSRMPVTDAKDFLDRAVTGLREAGAQEFLVKGLLPRVGFYRLRGEFDSARVDLSEALEIAEAGDMKLHLCDYHLEAARLCRDEKKETDAVEHERIAEGMIEEMEYYRRKRGIKK
jgi:hypothetical protein